MILNIRINYIALQIYDGIKFKEAKQADEAHELTEDQDLRKVLEIPSFFDFAAYTNAIIMLMFDYHDFQNVIHSRSDMANLPTTSRYIHTAKLLLWSGWYVLVFYILQKFEPHNILLSEEIGAEAWWY